jgi:hypothetical protein
MSSVGVTPNASRLSLLTAPGNPLSSVSTQIPQSVLDSASPSDLATISAEAISLSQTNALFGGAPQDSFQALDPTQTILDAVYGLAAPTQTQDSFTTTDPTLQVLDAVYGLNAGQSTAGASTTSTQSLQSELASMVGSGSSVNLLG